MLSRIHFQNELKLVDFIALNVCVIICMRTPHKCSLTLLFPASTFLSLSSTYSNYRLQYAIYLAIYCWLVSISVLKMCLFNTERCNGKQLMVRRYRWSGVYIWYGITNMPQASNHCFYSPLALLLHHSKNTIIM